MDAGVAPRCQADDRSVDSPRRRVATVADALATARSELGATPFDASPREGALLLGHVLGATEVELLAHGERALTEAEWSEFRALLDRRIAAEPVAYLTGGREFYGRLFATDRRALIPRPETEHLIELTLDLDLPADARVLDIGTGTGCIALTLALERPRWRVTAVDRSHGALALARENAARHGAGNRLGLALTDLASGLAPRSFDLVVSNPPYIAASEIPALSPEITDYEPHSALLSAGDDGTRLTGRLLDSLADCRPGTPVAVEIGAGRLGPVSRLAAARGFSVERVVDDYASIPRVVLLRRQTA